VRGLAYDLIQKRADLRRICFKYLAIRRRFGHDLPTSRPRLGLVAALFDFYRSPWSVDFDNHADGLIRVRIG